MTQVTLLELEHKNIRSKYNYKYWRKTKIEKPWYRFFLYVKNRVSHKESPYYKRKIKSFLSLEDFKFLWFRDKACLMKKPSIDRIDSKGHYILKNCRFIELDENRLGKRRKIKQFDLKGNFIREWPAVVSTMRKTGIKNICHCLTKRCNTAGGFIWKYSD